MVFRPWCVNYSGSRTYWYTFIISSIEAWALYWRIRLMLAKSFSIGFNSGEYGGKNNKLAPESRMNAAVCEPLWKDALSIIRTCLSSSNGQSLWKPRVESNRITAALEKQRCRETPLKTCSNQRRGSIPMTWHFLFNTDPARGISLPTEIGFTQTRLVNINGGFALRLCRCLKGWEILLTFYRTLFFVGRRLFFRVILSCEKA